MNTRTTLITLSLLLLTACRGDRPAAQPDLSGVDLTGLDATGCPDGAGGIWKDLAYTTIAGVDAKLLSLDLYVPQRADPCRLAPLVVWVHGGGWAIGDKGNQIADKRDLLMGNGYALASVNYRLSTSGSSVKYPVHEQDVASALGWLRQHAREYGADGARVAILGHSAGAGIVALLGTDGRFLMAGSAGLDSLRCVGSLDTESYDIPRALTTADNSQKSIYANAFGDDPKVLADASPINHVAAGKSIPPFLLARRGAADRRALCDDFAAKLRGAGVEARVIDAGSLTHEEVNERIGAAGDTIMTPPVLDFLRTACFR